MTQLTQQQIQFIVPQSLKVPPEGPECLRLILDFVASAQYVLDLFQVVEQARMSMVQGMYVDMSGASDTMEVSISPSGQTLQFASNTQGYYTVLAPNPPVITFNGNSTATGVVNVYVYNMPIADVNWSTA